MSSKTIKGYKPILVDISKHQRLADMQAYVQKVLSKMATEIKYLDSENEEIQIVDEADWEMAIEEHRLEVRFEVFVKIDESKPFLTDEEIYKSLGNIEKQAIERIIEKKV